MCFGDARRTQRDARYLRPRELQQKDVSKALSSMLMALDFDAAFQPGALSAKPHVRSFSRGRFERGPAPEMFFDEVAQFFQNVGKEARASHILVANLPRAKEIKEKIEAGEMTFDTAARTFSSCPSAQKGGDLGSFGYGQMVGDFNAYCFNPDSKVGELGIVETKFGTHIIRLTKKP